MKTLQKGTDCSLVNQTCCFLFFVDYRNQRLPWIYVYFLHSGNLQFHEREFSFPNPYKWI